MSKSRDIADSAATINYIDGLTSDAQTQLDGKATLDASPTFTGTVTATAFSGDGSGLTGVDSLPSQTGNNGLFLTTDGSTASWAEAGGGAWTFINSTTVTSSVSSIDITSGIDSTYDMYVLELIKVEPAATGGRSMYLRTSTDGGSSFDTSGYSYGSGTITDVSASVAISSSASDSFINLSDAGLGSNAGEFLTGFIYLVKPSEAANFVCFWDLAGLTMPTSKALRVFGSGQRETAADVDAIRIYMSSGNIVSGTVRLYGIANSQEQTMTRYKATPNGNVQFTPEEETAWDAQEAEYAAGADDRVAEEVRAKRDSLLAESDWTQVADAPVDKAAWATYRQSLRDIPQQAGFPTNVVWPVEPN